MQLLDGASNSSADHTLNLKVETVADIPTAICGWLGVAHEPHIADHCSADPATAMAAANRERVIPSTSLATGNCRPSTISQF